jgi:ClpP class serine protease
MLPFIDSAEKFRSQGLKVEVFAAGKFKGMGTPGVSLSEEQRALIQSDLEEVAADFKTAVLARGRKIPDEAMEGQSFSARKAQRFNLAGTVKSRDEVIARLRSIAARVDTPSRTSTPMKTAEEQLTDALARIQTLEADAKARESLMTDASAQVETFKASLATKEQAHQTALQQVCTERDTLKGQLIAVQGDVERHSKRAGELETQVRDLNAREQDLDKRASAKAAQIAAEMGTQVPAKITPAGDKAPTTAAEVWNRQFAKA